MPRNGSGTYTRTDGVYTGSQVWTNERDANVKIRADRSDTHDQDMADAITASLAKDGQTTPTADLPMGTYKHTGVGNGTARNHYGAIGQIQDSSFTWCGTAAGTQNALTFSPTPVITAYAAGQSFVGIIGASSTNSTATLAVSGLATKAIQINGAALSSSVVLETGKLYRFDYEGTQFQATRLSPSPALADPMTTRGDIIVRNSSNATARLAVGTANYLLKSDGTDAAWGTVATDSIADDAVSLAKMASGTAGRIVGYDTSGNPEVQRIPQSNKGYVTDRYYHGSFFIGTNSSSFAVTVDRLYGRLFDVLERTTFTRIGTYVQTAAGTVGRLGIYNWAPAAVDRTLVLDAGTVSTASSTAEVEATISQVLMPGVYILACVFDNTPAIRGGFANAQGAGSYIGLTAQGSGANTTSFYTAHTFGALPATFGALTYTDSNASATVSPTTWMRVV
jgi:hypothetical protein